MLVEGYQNFAGVKNMQFKNFYWFCHDWNKTVKKYVHRADRRADGSLLSKVKVSIFVSQKSTFFEFHTWKNRKEHDIQLL